MATDPIKKIYLYNAHGYGLGGRIDRPFQHVLDVHAGASLPTTGGFEVSRAENYRLNETISFQAAHTMVSGSLDEEDGTYNSLSSATIEGLNILNMVTADRIVAHVASKQRLDDAGTNDHAHRQPFRKPANCRLPNSSGTGQQFIQPARHVHVFQG